MAIMRVPAWQHPPAPIAAKPSYKLQHLSATALGKTLPLAVSFEPSGLPLQWDDLST